MAGGSDGSAAEVLSADEAFSILGNEIRIQILQALGTVGGTMSFSDLRREAAIDDPGKFHYHLDRLTGHFIEGSDEGYRLRPLGKRVIQAILSGTVTESPALDPTPIDWRCHLCGSEPLHVDYRDEQVGVYCRSCAGIYGGAGEPEAGALPAQRERLYYMHLPPAGIADRSPEEIVRTASRWTNAETVTAASGICPRCSAQLQESATICEDHRPDDGRCPTCDNRFAALHQMRCQNCVFELEALLVNKLLVDLEFRTFLIDQGLNPVHPQDVEFLELFHFFEEEVRSVDPLDISFSFTTPEETIRVTLGDDLTVTAVERHETEP